MSRTKSATPKSAPTVSVRIELTPATQERIIAVAERFGMTQFAVTSRLVEWFARQPATFPTSILGGHAKGTAPDVARSILERMVAASPNP